MKTLNESVANAMDSQDVEIVPFLPYILQDFWEIGTPAETVINIVKKHCKDYSNLRVLDLGCGKGAISVKLAVELKCNCYGIDGIAEFIETSKEKANEYGVGGLCRFETGDIRDKIKTLEKFDVIVLAGIGQVFGNYFETLTTLSKHLTPQGIIIIDDAYIDDSSTFKHPALLHHGELLKQVEMSEINLIDEHTTALADATTEFENLQKRCKELSAKHPEKAALFESYTKTQADEYDALENELVCSVIVFKKA
ncbi:MAG: class I SAM-dependent methyltransferase [Elusimicrobia bacterium]|nr:class I SAM-dependent methyltransferase [Elusimicrobiota bacterium]